MTNTSIKATFERCYKQAIASKGTNYYKHFIEGNTGIYYAHPVHGHADYNKFRVCNKTAYTIRLMREYNNKLSNNN